MAGQIVSCQQVRLEMMWDNEGAYIGWDFHTKIIHDSLPTHIDQVGAFYTWVPSRGYYVYRGDVKIAEFEGLWDEQHAYSVLLSGVGEIYS